MTKKATKNKQLPATLQYDFFPARDVTRRNLWQKIDATMAMVVVTLKQMLTKNFHYRTVKGLCNHVWLVEALPMSEIFDYRKPNSVNFVPALDKFNLPSRVQGSAATGITHPTSTMTDLATAALSKKLLFAYTKSRIVPELLVEAYLIRNQFSVQFPEEFSDYRHHLRLRERKGIRVMRKVLQAAGLTVPPMCEIVISMQAPIRKIAAAKKKGHLDPESLIDVMGEYDHNNKRITIFMPLVRKSARSHDLSTADLFLFVLLHEIGHYYMHHALRNNKSLSTAIASSLDDKIHESWANFFAYYALFVTRAQTNFRPGTELVQIKSFQNGLKSVIANQPEEYRIFEKDILGKLNPPIQVGSLPDPNGTEMISILATRVAKTLPSLIAAGASPNYQQWVNSI